MNIDENTAVETTPVSEQSADVQAQETNALDEFMAEDTESTEDVQETVEAEEDSSEQTTETETEEVVPKGIKGRILKAEEKADKRGYDRAQSEWASEKAEYLRRISEYEAKEAEAEIKKEAASLAGKEHVSVEFAERLLRAERGIAPKTSEKTESSKTNEPVLTEQRKTQLNSQIDQIKKRYAMDVMDYVTDEDAKAIFEGNMELWEVALRAGRGTAKAEPKKASAPTPVKSGGNNTPTGGMDFSTMSDEEFDRFNAKISRGAVFKPRK